MSTANEIKLFSGTGTPRLAHAVAEQLGTGITHGTVSQFPDGETRINIEESVRGADCFVIQSTSSPVNHNLMELLVMADALRRASAWRINAVIPYFGYARQDKKVQAREPITAKLVANLLETAGVDRVITVDLHAGQIQGFFNVPVNHNLMELLVMADALRRASAWRINAVIPYFGYARQDKKVQAREPITAKRVANLLETAGVDRVITVDLHAGQIQGFFNVPVDHLTAMDILAAHLKETDLENSVVVSPDVGRAIEARRLANRLHLPLAMLYKRRTSPTETEVTHVIGEVEGMRPIFIDDMITTAGTMRRGIDSVLRLGAAEDITVAATHAVFTPPAFERLSIPAVRRIVVTDTVPFESSDPRVEILSVAGLLAQAIHNVHNNESVSSLFSS